jgi:HAD superfamily hydrolase (TIGR01509 family)
MSHERLHAIIFDLDGLIVDTETPDFKTWQDVYRAHGHDLPLEKWGQIIGGTGASHFDPQSYLEELCGEKLNSEDIWIERRKAYVELLDQTDCLPGVCELAHAASAAGLCLAVASSSPENWVTGHLTRLGIIEHFSVVVTADDVEKTKPDPALFNLAIERLCVEKHQALILEDSPNGIAAARAAGVTVVVVPNPVTAQMDLSAADHHLKSLADVTLEQLANLLPDPAA